MPFSDYTERKHRANLQRYDRLIEMIYASAAREAASIGTSVFSFDPSKPFSFQDYPQTQARINSLLSRLHQDVQIVIVNGIDAAWTLANNRNSELANRVFGKALKDLPQRAASRYYNNNEAARDAFLARKTDGLGLSDRVWKYSNQFRQEIEMGLDLGIRNGLSAEEMARDLKQYLNEPSKLFRRVRDEHGELQLSKNAAAYHPGAGVYRSSHKNAVRLARTETNMAYRTSDHTRWGQLTFVVGQQISLSGNHPEYDICDELAGRYPKSFLFRGWHPNCICFSTPILKTPEELQEETQRIINGEETTTRSKNEITELPGVYRRWVAENRDRIESAKSLPYFLRDNKQFTTGIFKASGSMFVMDATSASWLKERGYALKIADEKQFTNIFNNSPMSGYDIQQFDKEFTQIFEGVGGVVDRRDLTVSESRGRFLYGGKWQGKSFYLERSFRIEDGVKCVHHDLFELPKELQGGGISKKVFSSLYEQYQKAGIQKIDVFANIDIGGYTWAKYGFCADRNDIERIISRRVDNGMISGEIAADAFNTVTEFFEKNKSANRFPMNLLADKDYGKKLLLGTNWSGYLDLRDKEQRAVFEAYLRR